jgi:hypothetical protein
MVHCFTAEARAEMDLDSLYNMELAESNTESVEYHSGKSTRENLRNSHQSYLKKIGN